MKHDEMTRRGQTRDLQMAEERSESRGVDIPASQGGRSPRPTVPNVRSARDNGLPHGSNIAKACPLTWGTQVYS
jgi:hypothetical protein